MTAGDILLSVVVAIIGVLLTMILRKVGNVEGSFDAFRDKLTRIEVVVIGINGDNGLNGELKQLRRDFDDHERRHGPADRRSA